MLETTTAVSEGLLARETFDEKSDTQPVEGELDAFNGWPNEQGVCVSKWLGSQHSLNALTASIV